jgi:general stress protein 26
MRGLRGAGTVPALGGWLAMGRRHSSNREGTARVWDIIEKVGVCMLVTRFGGGLRARPLEARPDRAAGLIFFVTDVDSPKEDEIESEHDVCLVFIDPRDKAYLSITARAEARRDHAKAAEVWKATDDAWWDGPRDPNVCVLRVTPLVAELWDGPASKAAAIYELAKARLTGDEPNLGENRKVTVPMMQRTSDRRRSDVTQSSKAPSALYRRFRNAIRARRPIACMYDGLPREVCPIILGYSEDAQESVFVFQFGGKSTGKLPDWRCFRLSRVSAVRLHNGEWRSGTSHTQPQTCIKHVDVDANIPETLTDEQPLPFGSPKLRPPRGSG